MMLSIRCLLAISILLCLASVLMSTRFNDANHQREASPSIASSLFQKRSLSSLPSLPVSPTGSSQPLSVPPDPFAYYGPKGFYILSHYTGDTLTQIWVATFLFQCLVGLFNDISIGGHQPSEPYPNGRFSCNHEFPHPYGPAFRAVLILNKIRYPGWHMTYADLAADVEALWYAALWFSDEVYGFPMMDLTVNRFLSGDYGPTFFAEQGHFRWEYLATNASMLVRRIQANPRPWLPLSRRSAPWRVRHRLQSSGAPPNASPSFTQLSPLSALTADLDRLAPRIDINADQIEIIHGPKEFYETLKAKIRGAKRRINLSTLYIGKAEHELISTLQDALQSNGLDLKVSILTDALRGTREAPDPSCASLLASLVEEFPDQVEIRMYHTPNLTGFRKALVPKRINEGWGLQHIKLYGIDDEVILSGANLSNDYFTDRQDRYHLFSSKRVTDYFATIHHAVCSVSFRLHPSNTPSSFKLEWPPSNPAPNPLDAPKSYIQAATTLLAPLSEPRPSQAVPTTSTSLYPLLCHPPTINTELPAFTSLLSHRISSYTFTAGYFNPHPMVTSSLLAASSHPLSCPGTIITASPYANGFFGSKGISGMLPAAYTHLSLRFLQAARGKNIQLREWQRGVVGQKDGWTYHAKGLWVTMPQEADTRAGPSATLIGSSNYTTRSYGLDLEVGAMVITSDEGLMRKWKREEEMLAKPSRPVGEEDLAGDERRAGWKVRAAMWAVRMVGGAL